MDQAIKFSVIIPSYNNPGELSEMLGSVQDQCKSIDEHEVIVVDDGSRDNKIKEACQAYPFASYIKCEKNRGVASARNAGASAAKNDILVFIDSDSLVESDFIAVLEKQFARKDVVAVSGTLSVTPANPSPYRNYWSLYKDFNMPKGEFTTLFTGQEGAIRREVFEETGRWDGNIRGVSKEEYEFTERLERLGHRINYEPKFVIRPRFKNGWELLLENFKRTKKWCIIFLSRKKFDDYTSTFSGGMSFLLGALTLVTGIGALVFSQLKLVFLLSAAIFLLLTVSFWRHIIKKKGIGFMALCVFFHIITSLSISFGALFGFAYILAGEKARREAINN